MAGTILSVDIGTSSLKAAFIDFDGRLLAFGRADYGSGPSGIVDAAAWERAFVRALKELRDSAPGRAADGVCVSGNGPTLVPVSGDGDAPPLYWHGGRMALPPEKGALSFFLPHAAWFKRNAPGQYKKTKFFISSHEWLARRLGAEALAVLPQAAYEPYYWDDGQCRLYGLDREKFPPFVKMGEIMGRVSREAASRLAPFAGGCVKSGTPIVAGAPDFIAALIGTAALEPGDACDRAGSSEGVNVCAAGPQNAAGLAADGIRALPHAKEGLWNIGALIPSSGRLFDAYRAATGRRNRSYEEQLAELIPSGEPSPRNAAPGQAAPKTAADSAFPAGRAAFSACAEFFDGPFFFPPPSSERGDLESFRDAAAQSGFSGDSVGLGRAVLRAMGFSVRSALEKLAARGFAVSQMRVSGGQGKNPRWNQLKADIAGVSLMIPEIPDGELAGNAALAAAALDGGANRGGGMEEAARRMIRFRDVYKPRAAAFWEENYRLYLREAAARQA